MAEWREGGGRQGERHVVLTGLQMLNSCLVPGGMSMSCRRKMESDCCSSETLLRSRQTATGRARPLVLLDRVLCLPTFCHSLEDTYLLFSSSTTSQFTALAMNKPSSPRSRSESTSQFTASALNKLSSSEV